MSTRAPNRILATCGLLALFADPGPALAQEPAAGTSLGDDLVLQVYDVRDLVPDLEIGPALRLTLPGDESAPEALPETAEQARNRKAREFVARLAERLRHFVQPPLEGAAAISPVGGSHLTAIAHPEQHAWLERCLQRHRDHQDAPLQLDTVIYSMTDEAWGRLGLGDQPLPMTAAQWRKLETRLQGDDDQPGPGIDMLSAPAIVCLPLSHVHMMAIDQTAYIADFEVLRLEVGGAKQVIADPVVRVAESGIWLEGSMLLADDGTLGFDFSFRNVDLEKPIPTAEVRLEGIDTPFTIQRPTLHELEVRARATAVPGSAVAFPSPESVNGRRLLLVLLPGMVAQQRELRVVPAPEDVRRRR